MLLQLHDGAPKVKTQDKVHHQQHFLKLLLTGPHHLEASLTYCKLIGKLQDVRQRDAFMV
jgi:hypothetical protein